MRNAFLPVTNRLVSGVALSVGLWGSATTSSLATIVTYQEGVSPTGAYNVNDSELRSSSPNGNFNTGNIDIGQLFGTTYRGVLEFNLLGTGGLPAGATVNSVTLTLYSNNTTGIDNSNGGYGWNNNQMDLHKITTNFSENTVTWNSPWTNPGGDFNAGVLASVTPTGAEPDGTAFTFPTSAAFVAAVNDAVQNQGGILRTEVTATNEGLDALLLVFSSENMFGTSAVRPLLSIDYTAAVPEPGVIGLLVLGGWLIKLRRRRLAQ